MILVEKTMIIAVFDDYTQVEQGYLIDGFIYPMGEVIDIKIPENVTASGKWCYTMEKGFYENPLWLQSTDKAIQDAIDAYNLELIESGVM